VKRRTERHDEPAAERARRQLGALEHCSVHAPHLAAVGLEAPRHHDVGNAKRS